MDEPGSKSDPFSKRVIREELSKFDASEIMIPRSEIVMLNLDSPFQEIINTIYVDGHSRFPVFHEKVDNIVGVLYAKDLLILFKNPENIENFDIKKILRKPFFVSENKKADDLLSEFRLMHVHMALVVDEYGSFTGIATLEDILEEIVGEISDEYDKDEMTNYVSLNKKESIVLPKMPLDEFNKIFKTRIKSEEFDTIGGFIIDRFGHVPHAGEEIKYRNILFNIKKVEGSKIKEIHVSRR